MTLKLWDVNMEASPVATHQVHEYLRPKLCDLYENDSIFDKFECCLRGDGLITALIDCACVLEFNLFRVFGASPGSDESTLEASKSPNSRRLVTPSSKPPSRLANLARGGRNRRVTGRDGSPGSSDFNGGAHDFSSKLLHFAWHPQANVNNLNNVKSE